MLHRLATLHQPVITDEYCSAFAAITKSSRVPATKLCLVCLLLQENLTNSCVSHLYLYLHLRVTHTSSHSASSLFCLGTQVDTVQHFKPGRADKNTESLGGRHKYTCATLYFLGRSLVDNFITVKGDKSL